jgi:hypothetical protein
VRLTLRTLLAYLDDTLEPMEIKKIGQKVAESDHAQELIARIKQITRRRRLTTPPATGPGAFDPNMVADYLDNELSAEEVAELEKICLESDVHLAEVASCHQILTLVLGEPALVPPTAKERMYSLVRGREAIPFRKASTPGGNSSSPNSSDADADEMFLLGLPFYRRGSRLRWALPLAGVVLLAVLGVAIWQTIPHFHTPQVAEAKNDTDNGDQDKKDKEPVKDDKKDKEPVKDDKKDKDPVKDDKKDKDPVKDDKKNEVPDTSKKNDPIARKTPPLKERKVVGKYYTDAKSPVSILVQRKNNEDRWQRLRPDADVFSNDRVVSLPGYASQLRLNSGVHLLLRGLVREFALFDEMIHLQECAVVLHPSKDVDTDLTLERGRLYVSNHKEKDVVVRLRFGKEVWDLTLHPETEVAVDYLKHYLSGSNYNDEEPDAKLALVMLKGRADLAVEYNTYSDLRVPGPGFFLWENRGPGLNGPNRLDKEPEIFAKAPPATPAAEKMEKALTSLSQRMLLDKVPTVVLEEILQKTEDPWQHQLAIYCLGALDEAKKLIDILGDQDPVHALDRDTAIFTLRHWLDRDASQGRRLYDPKNKSSILLADREYTSNQADTIFVLLHSFKPEAEEKPETYELLTNYLLSDKVAIAELARWQLYRFSRHQGVRLPSLDKFNAALPKDSPERENAAKEVRDKVKEGALPPRQPRGGKGPKPGPLPKPMG